jgi:hypothetical protein
MVIEVAHIVHFRVSLFKIVLNFPKLATLTLGGTSIIRKYRHPFMKFITIAAHHHSERDKDTLQFANHGIVPINP